MITEGARRMQAKLKASVESDTEPKLASSQPTDDEKLSLYNHIMRNLQTIQDDSRISQADMNELKKGWGVLADRLYEKKACETASTHQKGGGEGTVDFPDDYNTSKKQLQRYKRAS